MPTLSYLTPLKGGIADDQGHSLAMISLGTPLRSINKKGVDPLSPPLVFVRRKRGTHCPLINTGETAADM